jgi:hypothetical protein
MNESLRASLILLCCGASIVWLGVGCIAPLTPSDGYPSFLAIVVFYILPIVISLWMLKISKKMSERIFSSAALLVIIIFGGWVLGLPHMGKFR